MKKTALIWFRNDLRTLDHPGLQEATQKYERVIAYYSFDPRHYTTDRWGFKKTERYRAQFLLQTLKDLREQLSQLNISLIVETQTPETGLPQIIQKWAVQTVFLQAEWTEEEMQVEDAVRNQVDASIQWRQVIDNFCMNLPRSLCVLIRPPKFLQFLEKNVKNMGG